jgi:predicted Zn-dependent peptidase
MYDKKVLDNGLTIITAPIKDSLTTTVLVLVGVGSRYETQAQNGLSHFLEHMMFKGTKNRPSAHIIASELDALGASYNAFTGQEYTGYWVKVRSPHKDIAMDVIADIFQNSLLKAEDIKVERGAIVEELNMYLDLPMRYVNDVFQKLLYKDTPLGREIIGPKENILNFSQEQFREYFDTKYVSKNTYVVLAGDLTPETVSQVEKLFSNIRVGERPQKDVVDDTQNTPQVSIFQKNTDQSHMMYGFRTFDVHNKDRYTAAVISTILGGYMSSRLFSEIREKRGLAYYVKASSDHFDDAGYLAVNAGIRNDKIFEAINIVSTEFTKLKTTPVDEVELSKAKENMKGKMVMGLEGSDDVAEIIAMTEMMTAEKFDLEEELRNIDLVTSNKILDFMNQYCTNERLNLAVIGDYKDDQQFIDLLKV